MFTLSLKALLTLAPFITFSSGAILEYRKNHGSGGSTSGSNGTCTSIPQFLSCENTTEITDTCCTPTPGGLVIQTQFWDTYTGMEKSGQLLPKNNWTIHGLWPDNCDGSFESYCDFERQFDERPSPSTVNGQTVPRYSGPTVDTFITAAGRDDLLAFMKKYWVSQGSSDASFWAHEYSKHGTCFSTFDTKCYSSDTQHEDLIDFFETVTKAWLKYPTYDWLAAADIVPSNSTTYKLSDMQDALKSKTGALPYLGCHNKVLSEVWYYSHSLGPVQNLDFHAVDTTTKTTCPESGIHYYERSSASEA